MKKKITLREIASKAKVSAATASIVLNDKKNQGISEKTWENVKKIANKFNYSGTVSYTHLTLPTILLV